MDCIFCKIVYGEIPSYTIYENEAVKAFLDIQPISEGHALIIPKKHYSNLYEMDEEILKKIEKASQEVGKLLKEKLNCQGITRIQNNEYGQEVKHYHMHIIPRYEGDGIVIKHEKNNTTEVEDILKKII